MAGVLPTDKPWLPGHLLDPRFADPPRLSAPFSLPCLNDLMNLGFGERVARYQQSGNRFYPVPMVTNFERYRP
jgi:hypothetical protein